MEKRTGKGNVLKVVELGMEHRVYDAMKDPKFSVENLTRQLNAEGITITSQSIRNLLKRLRRHNKNLLL